MLLLAIIALVRFANQKNILPIHVIRHSFTTACISLAAIVMATLPCTSGSTAIAQQVAPSFTAPNRSTASTAPRYMPNGNQTKSGKLLREGTLIPPTVGTIVPIGRRWGFEITPRNMLPQQNRHRETRASSTSGTNNIVGTQNGSTQHTRIGITNVETNGRQVMQVIEIEQRSETAVGGSPQPNQGNQPNQGKRQTIIFAENLMLQRIVEAVVADAADDCWTISGTITEFRNQNRLLIKTAERSNQN